MRGPGANQSTRGVAYLAGGQRLSPARKSGVLNFNAGKNRERCRHGSNRGPADFVAESDKGHETRRNNCEKFVRDEEAHATATLISGMPVRTSSLVMLMRVYPLIMVEYMPSALQGALAMKRSKQQR